MAAESSQPIHWPRKFRLSLPCDRRLADFEPHFHWCFSTESSADSSSFCSNPQFSRGFGPVHSERSSCFVPTARSRKCGIGDAVGTIISDRPPHRTVRALLRIRLPPWMSRLGFDEACPKTPSFLTPQVADSTHSIFVSFACPKSDGFGRFSRNPTKHQ